MKQRTLRYVLYGKHTRDVVMLFSNNPELVFSSYEVSRSVNYDEALTIIKRLLEKGILVRVQNKFYQIAERYRSNGFLVNYIKENYP